MNEESGNLFDTANDTPVANTAALNLLKKIREAGTPLGEYVKGRLYRGIKTGFHKAFVINEITRDQLIANDAKSAELIKPWLRGRDLRRWQAQTTGQYVIMIPSSANHAWAWADTKNETKALQLFEKAYPAIYAHLMTWEEKLRQRHDHGQYFWELRSCAYYTEFAKPKIIYPETTKWMRACYDTTGAVCANTVHLIPTDDLYLLAILQSKIFDWYARHEFQTLGNPWSFTGRVRFMTQHLESFPLFPAMASQQAPIIERVSQLLTDMTAKQYYLADEIDEHLYELYQLTDSDRQLILEAEQQHSFTAKYAGIWANIPEMDEEEEQP